MTVELAQPPFGSAEVGRGLRVRCRIDHRSSDSPAAPATFGSRWTYRVRAWDPDGALDAFVIDELVNAAADQVAEQGWLNDYVPCGATAYDSLRWELVEVDADTADTNTSTGQAESVLLRWHDSIAAAAVV